MITITVELVDDDGEVETHTLPTVYAVCGRCRGEGKHVNPAVDGHGITAREFEEEWSTEEREEYFDGRYDVTCSKCGGQRVVRVLDEDKVDPALLKRIHEREDDRAAFRRECEMERRMGA